MDTAPDHRLEELARQKLEGRTYSSIKEELRLSGMDEEKIGLLIRQVDERVLKENQEQGKRQQSLQWIRWGWVLAVAGLLITIAYKRGIILTRLPALLIYIPFVAGILLMLYGRMSQRKLSDHSPKGPGAIRKKRPYK